MILKEAHSVEQYGEWAVSKGFTVTEGPGRFGPVHSVHVEGSLHYVDRALDIHYYPKTGSKWATESAALNWLYRRTLQFKNSNTSFPLDEMFFNGFGYVKELRTSDNHPIGGHDSHLHVGWTKTDW